MENIMADERLNLSDVMSGAEPTWKDIKPEVLQADYKILLMRALGWYSRERTLDDSVKYFINHFKSEGISPNIPVMVVSNIGHLCRMVSRGFPLTKELETRIQRTLKAAKAASVIAKEQQKKKVEAEAAVVKKEVYIVPGAIVDPKVSSYLERFDDHIDALIGNNSLKSINLHLLGFSKKQRDEIKLYVNRFKENMFSCTDEEIGLPAKTRNAIKTFVDKIIEEVGATPVKIARIKKPQSKEKQVEKLKLNPKSPIDKEQIINSKVVILFDETARKVRLYVSDDGIKVKGSTLLNFDPDKSYVKTIRKPEEFLTKVKTFTKVQLLKDIEAIKCKPSRANGRVNEALSLLKVY
jgi:hypothetical protein